MAKVRNFEFERAKMLKEIESAYKRHSIELAQYAEDYDEFYKYSKRDFDEFHRQVVRITNSTPTEREFSLARRQLDDEYESQYFSHFISSEYNLNRLEVDIIRAKGDLLHILFRRNEIDGIEKKIKPVDFDSFLEFALDEQILHINELCLVGSKIERLKICNSYLNKITNSPKISCNSKALLQLQLKAQTEINRIRVVAINDPKINLSVDQLKRRFKIVLMNFLEQKLQIHPIENFLHSELIFSKADGNNRKMKFEIIPVYGCSPVDVINALILLKRNGKIYCTFEELKWWIFGLLGSYPDYSIHNIHTAIYRKIQQ